MQFKLCYNHVPSFLTVFPNGDSFTGFSHLLTEYLIVDIRTPYFKFSSAANFDMVFFISQDNFVRTIKISISEYLLASSRVLEPKK